MSEFQFLDVRTTDHVATVTMDNPPVNAVGLPMYDEIKALFTGIEQHAPGARAVILTGAGKHFCGGNDLDEFLTMTPENTGGRMLRVREAFWSIYDCPAPVIAAVHGVAVGTGLALAASCDMVVAAEGARFGLPEIQVGAMGGAKHASRLVPQALVRRMHFTGDMVPVEELARYGGIDSVVPAERLLTAAEELARRIVRHSPVAIRTAKRSLNRIEYMELKEGYTYEQSLTGELSAHDDAKEAVRAFFERREPRYTGK
ncbi:enoyl-CoA hydratase-related protein [Streptomyces sp. NPDC001812]|uniref:enoyl-CoA hydratase-related protein n=1 Tax=Streptomyces sp. NPDC001812 TaxID=3364611 RepID=UPI0036CEFCDA